MSVRVRFAPSPTGNVHIGNIRAAIFNWLYARSSGGRFLLRVEDTDLARSTPEAVQTLLQAMEWLGLDFDDEPVYQSSRRREHEAAAAGMVEAGFASRAGDDSPTILHLGAWLFDPAFVTEPRDEIEVSVGDGELLATPRGLEHRTTSSKGATFTDAYGWDALGELRLVTEDGTAHNLEDPRKKLDELGADAAEEPRPAADLVGAAVIAFRFKRRYVYYDDLILGRLEKPLDSMSDPVVARSDGTPVFHLANVVDDASMGITHVLRGNDHVENTYRHLFIYKALGLTPPRFGHLPMIVNQKGKPYSKRDGDAYVGDFRLRGFLPGSLFNFLALCGWSPGDDREVMTREELVAAFSLERVKQSAAQLDPEKLEWMNSRYLADLPDSELGALARKELAAAGHDATRFDEQWFAKLLELTRPRIRTIAEFVPKTDYFFTETVELQPKAVKKVLKKKDGAGLKVLGGLRKVLAGLETWGEADLESTITAYSEEQELKMGQVAQPLRVAVTGGTASPGIWETLALVGRERGLARIERVLAEVEP